VAIYYRGDNRGPDGPQGIFMMGFERKGYEGDGKYVTYNQVGTRPDGKPIFSAQAPNATGAKIKKVPFDSTNNTGLRPDIGDMNPWASVCISTRLEVAPLFPVGNDNTRWIYAFHLDESFIKNPKRYSQYVDTHAWQKEQGFQWPDFAWEEAVGAIDPPDIIGAVEVNIQRIQCNSFGQSGPFKARYQTFRFKVNPHCTVEWSIKSAVQLQLVQWARSHSGSFCGITPDPNTNTTRPDLI